MNKCISAMTRQIRSAGCLIIGDEVLNGKILDTNLFEFAKYCFNELAIPLKKTIVCGDDKVDIIKSLQILRDEKCDFIVTSGGIGSTHDDITYESLAEAFHVPCALDEETVQKMNKLRGSYLQTLQKPQREAFYRMATIPQDSNDVSVLKLYTDQSLWVPIVGIDSQVYILPGVPQLFKQLLPGLGESVKSRVLAMNYRRCFVKTTSSESNLAPFLGELQRKCNAKYGTGKMKLGSYPHFSWKTVSISIIADESVSAEEHRLVVAEVIANIGEGAQEISEAEENFMSTQEPREESHSHKTS